MKKPRNLWLVFFLAATCLVLGQEGAVREGATTAPAWNLDVKGYIKYMQSLGFAKDLPLQVDNLVHNRLHFNWYNQHGSAVVMALRNRVFFGATVRQVPGYGALVNSYDGVLPLEYLLVDQSRGVLNTIVDRLYYEYANERLQWRIGRQRINWGINTTWNPNDLFNNYNIYDFDYEEREGADAISLTLFPDSMSAVELAYKFTGDSRTDVFAAKYKFNRAGYDWQVLLGKFQEHLTMGGGWAGNIGSLGFKGELSYFQSLDDQRSQSNLSVATSLDYAWANGVYLTGNYLYNALGASAPIDIYTTSHTVPDATALMPARHNFMLGSRFSISPLLNTAMTVVYMSGLEGLTVFPTLSFAAMTNLDLDLIGQFFWQKLPQAPFANTANGCYWRLKYSF